MLIAPIFKLLKEAFISSPIILFLHIKRATTENISFSRCSFYESIAYLQAITSTSQSTFLGNVLTATQERAGLLTKYLA